MSKIKEKELKELLLDVKNEKTFERFYSKYNGLVYRIAFSILKNQTDSEDVMQIVFAKIYSTEKDKMPTKKEANWLYTLTKNETISYLRKKKKDINLEDIYEIESNDNELDKIIEKDAYASLISRLSPKEKEIISLKMISDLSFQEIAKILNEPIGTVKWRYYKSIHTLKLFLTNLGMFIITFVIGIKTLLHKEKTNNIRQEIKEDSETNQKNELEQIEEEKNQLQGEEEQRKDITENIQEDKDSIEENELQQGTEVMENTVQRGVNYKGLGILSISAIFLIITVIFSIFLIKYQRKPNQKKSK